MGNSTSLATNIAVGIASIVVGVRGKRFTLCSAFITSGITIVVVGMSNGANIVTFITGGITNIVEAVGIRCASIEMPSGILKIAVA